MKTEQRFCQSCGMPLNDVNDYGTNGRTRQTLWGECTDANLKTVAKRYMIEKK